MSDFKVGQRVLCIDTGHHAEWTSWPTIYNLDGLKVGKIYTISAILSEHGGHDTVVLKEIVRPMKQPKNFAGFSVLRFKPIEEKEYDISIFRQMCRDAEAGIVKVYEDG